MIIFWLLPISVIFHITEEFVFPGGFLGWYRNYKQTVSSSFTSTYIVLINSILFILCALPLVLDGLQSISLWLSMASVVFFNALFHLNGSMKVCKYSPGIVTSVLLYIPISIYGYWFILSNQLISKELAVSSSLVGIIYLLFSSFNHKRRARKFELTKHGDTKKY